MTDGSGPASRGPHRGDLVGGHRVERQLGAGAMGTVWLAEHVTLGRRVALKILAHGLADDPAFQERFTREARLAARLDHPNVVPVYDAGTDPAGLWLSMRYVEGEDLRRRLNRVAAGAGDARGPGSTDGGGPGTADPDATLVGAGTADATVVAGDDATVVLRRGLPPEEAVAIVEGVAAGLDHAHERGILHRDVKPGNVLLEAVPHDPVGSAFRRPDPPRDPSAPGALPPFRRVLLADFGLTKELGEAHDLTQTGMLLGSVDSMAPEQIEGRAVDARADVYALASLLYVSLTGQPPFAGATMAKLFAHVNGERPRVSDVVPALAAFDDVVATGMAKDPDDRPSSAGALAGLARAALSAGPADPQATVAFPAPVPPRDRRPAPAPPRPVPTPPATGVPLAPRLRDGPVTPTEPRTRVAPVAARVAAPVAPVQPRTAHPGRGGPHGPDDGFDDPADPQDGGRSWLVPALVVGALVVALVVVLAVALGGGGSTEPRADAPTTTHRKRTPRSTPTTPASTAAKPAATSTAAAPPPATTTTGAAPPATDEDVSVDGGGTILKGDPANDPSAGTPLPAGGVAATYSAPDGAWQTLVARAGNGWEAPVRTQQGGGTLARLRQVGPDDRLILVDYTPSQAAMFDTGSGVLETRTLSGSAAGDVQAYRFKDDRIGSIPECARTQCVDVPVNASEAGPGWGILVAAPTAAEAWATAQRVVQATVTTG